MESLHRATSPEVAPESRIEHRILEAFGFSHLVDEPVYVGGTKVSDAEGNDVLGRNFLDAYPPELAEIRAETQDTLEEFLETPPTDPLYAISREAILERVKAFIAPPAPGA